MPTIPLPVGVKGDRDIPKLNESLVNLFHSEGTLLKTPGIESLSTGSGICRGSEFFEGSLYQVSGTDLIRISLNGTVTVIGTIDGSQQCVFAKSFIALVIVVKGGNGYVYTVSGGLSQITDSNYKTSIDVDSINQRFVFVPVDGSPLFYTDVNQPSVIPALNFFDAEFLPDKNTGVINLRNDLYVGGDNSFEVFRDTGDADAAFIRVDGAAIETGYVAAKARYKDTFVFLGHDRDGSYSFHGMAAGDAPKISNSAIDEILNNDYTEDELRLCLSQRFTWKGVDFVAFKLARHTFLYSGNWSYIQTGIDGLEETSPWDVNHITFAYGYFVTGSCSDGKIGRLADVLTEFGDKIERQIETFIKAEPDSYFIIMSIFLDTITGTNTEGTIGLQISRDNLAFGPQVFKSLGKHGRHQQQVVWRGGAGIFESFCGLRIRTTADVNFSLQGLTVNGG